MKKSIAILLVMVVALVSVFAAETSTLNLSTAVNDVLVGKIVAGTIVPSVSAYDGAAAKVDQVFSVEELSADFVYAYKTNLTKVPAVTFKADALKSGSNVMKYTITAGSPVDVAADGTGVTLLTAADDADVNAGLRVIGKTFNVAIASDDFTKAPAGNYTATITIEVKAN
ncbi:MAG: hypothetical protein SPD11_14205 [Sphaerochaetaceae bacterium]|nr:hypothetical protein [Sphaerochaetaceae bacterium]